MLRKIIIILLLLPILTLVGLYVTGNGFFVNALKRTYLQGHTTANINDHDAFDVATIAAGTHQALPQSNDYNAIVMSEDFEKSLRKTGTAAYVVLHKGEVVHEQYFGDYGELSRTNSFSMAKTVLTMMVGIAIEEGIIASFDQPITDYLPEFNSDELGKNATLAQLSLMNSGYDWVEHYYSWFSPTVELYHGSDVEEFLLGRSFSDAPTERWYYSSASTQLLAIALSRALEAKGLSSSLAEYLSAKIWQPMGMNDDGVWHTDEEGMELAYCCINSNARNFAKLGQLLLNNGRWGDQQIIPEAFVRKMIQPDGQADYGYSTWLNYDNNPSFYHFSGHLGQAIAVVPEHSLVVVRLGERTNPKTDFHTEEVPGYIDEAIRLAGLR